MNETRTLNRSKYECKYHLVFIPKYRKKTLYVELRQYLGEIFKELAKQRESCLLYTSPSPRDRTRSRMPSSA